MVGARLSQCGQSSRWARAGPRALVTFHSLPVDPNSHLDSLPVSGHGVIACSCHTPPETVFPRWDVKPQNLLTGNKGTVKVPDVGLARGVRWRPPGRGSPAAGSRSVGATSTELATKEPLSVGIRKLLRSSEFPERWPPRSEVWPGWNLHRTESTFPKWKPGAQRPGSETRATHDQIPRWKSSACRLLREP